MSEKQLTELLLCTLCSSCMDSEKFQLKQSIVFSSWKHLPYNVFHSAKSNLLANSIQIAPFAALCGLCYESTVLLWELNSQLEDIQKRILETSKELTAHVVEQAKKSKTHCNSSSPTAEEGNEQSPDNITEDITTEEFIIPDDCETTLRNTPDLGLPKTSEENENSSVNNIDRNKCSKCSRIFSGPKVLEKHSCRLKTWDCKKCGISYSGKRLLQDHLCGKRYICDICGVESDLLSNLVIHRSTHKNTLGFTCDLCPKIKRFPNKQSFIQHNKRKHQFHQEKRYQCHLCLKLYKNFNKLLSCQKKHKHGWTENSSSGNIAGDKRNQNDKEKEVQNQRKTPYTEESSIETTLMDADVQDPVLLQLDALQSLPQSSTTNLGKLNTSGCEPKPNYISLEPEDILIKGEVDWKVKAEIKSEENEFSEIEDSD